MAVIKDFYIGNAHIQICDDACVKTQAEIDEILKRCGDIWYRSELAKQMKEMAQAGGA